MARVGPVPMLLFVVLIDVYIYGMPAIVIVTIAVRRLYVIYCNEPLLCIYASIMNQVLCTIIE